MNRLNAQQRAAVQHLHSPLLVIAGAGSGKTGVITQKISYLVHSAGLPAQSIYALTFTNKAAREMQERCRKLLNSGAVGPNISTFHRLGLEIVRQEGQRLNLRRNFTILDAADCLNLLKELSGNGNSDQVKELQMLISSYKNGGIEPEEALRQQLPSAALYRAYEQRLRAYNVLDFDDLLVLPLRLFQSEREALWHWQSKIRYLLVDEYQDTNQCQYELLKLLVGDRPCLTAVGDDDQSIYGWRGAQPENIAQLQHDFPRLSTIKLEQNYRCHRQILACANALIAHNPHVVEKQLWSNLDAGAGVLLQSFADDRAEARAVVAEIDRRVKLYGYQPSDFAILYRSNFQSRVFEEFLRESRLDYVITGGLSLFDYAEIRDLLAYLRLINNPDDDSAFIRICNTPKREIGVTTLSKLSAYAGERQLSLFAACRDFGLISQLPASGHRALLAFVELVEGWQRAAASLTAAELLGQVIDDIRYRDHLEALHGDAQSNENRLKRLAQLQDWLRRWGQEDDRLNDLEALLDHLNLRDLLARQEDNRPAVQLMTLHSAKGLEFRQVFLVGCEEGLLPHANSQDSIEEERRLLYVGMTRAKEDLQLSYCRQRGGFNPTAKGKKFTPKSVSPSRFLQELPADQLRSAESLSPERQRDARTLKLRQFDQLLAGLEETPGSASAGGSASPERRKARAPQPSLPPRPRTEPTPARSGDPITFDDILRGLKP